MKIPRLFLFGGFLGSGKTTLLVELGSRLTAQGYKCAVITNDQGEFLVDTDYARSLGLAAGEVLKGCFCCNFTDFLSNIDEIIETVAPDYILAEPVGSCTDLTATVVNPFALYHRELAEICGFYVLADAPRVLGEYTTMNLKEPVTPREVLVSHQLKEAQILLLSKTDLVDAEERRRAEQLLKAINPEAELIGCSAHAGEGLDAIAAIMRNARPLEARLPLELDYQLYGEAEAEMGWYNGRFQGTAAQAFIPADLASALMLGLKAELGNAIVHAKVLIATEHGSVKLSLVSGRLQPDAAIPLSLDVKSAACVVNVRAAGPPEKITDAVAVVLRELEEDFGLDVSEYREDALVPAQPRPTHRLDAGGNRL